MANKIPRRWYQRPGTNTMLAAGAVVATGLAVAVVALVSPWPSALLIRAVFEKGARDTLAEIGPYAPTSGVDETLGIVYGEAGSDTSLNVFTPTGTTSPLATVVWIHGGAWISGDKGHVDPYVRILASHGYTTVSLNYTISPGATYPTALKQLNQALGFLIDHAATYRIDSSRIVIAGDSAGAQYASQLAALATNSVYARKLGVPPALDKVQLRGVILNCGIYDVSGIPNASGIGGWGFRTALWSYLGRKDWSATAGSHEMSTLNHVTKDFPATWISGGNTDPLTASQSKPMAKRLIELGVKVTAEFYPDDEDPPLPHEYQFHLKLDAARRALDSTLAFLDRVTAPDSR